MRNPLKRSAPRDASKPTLRARLAGAKSRLAGAKDKAGRMMKVNRIMLGMPVPEIAPPPAVVDRVALVNYATFLALERERVCAELYPHMGMKASRFVLSMNAAWGFFHEHDDSLKPPASTRALKVLDLVGIDWTADATENDRARYDDAGRADTGERPAVPHGWPAIDAELTEALDDMERLDAAQTAIYEAGNQEREGDTVPGYDALEDARGDAIRRLSTLSAKGLPGLQAKARAMLNPILRGVKGPFDDIAESLARDLIGARPAVLDQHRPDPIFAAIEEVKRLEAAADAGEAATPEGVDVSPEFGVAVWKCMGDRLLKTVPPTAAGCQALAAFVPGFFERWGASLEADAPTVLRLIARSPMRA